MKLRLGLGIGALALLIVGLAAWGSSLQRTIDGTIVVVGVGSLPGFTLGPDEAGALVLCTPAGAWPARSPAESGQVVVHVLPFTRILDSRGRLLASTIRFESLEAGQQIEIWTTNQTEQTSPPQVYATKIEVTGTLASGAAGEPCQAAPSASAGR
jgi:hypothetical protein